MTAWTDHHLLPQLALPPAGYRPPLGQIDVWTLHADPATVLGAHRLITLLTPTERHRADTLPTPGMRDTYLVTHVALRLVLGKCLGLSPRGVSITRAPCPLCDGPHGRPTLPTEADLHFSLSHVRNTVMIAIAKAPVGIDIEAADRVPADLLRRLHPNEQAAILRLPTAQRPAALLACWVRKEAYLKGLGTGLGIPLHQADVGPGPAFGGCGTGKATAWQLSTIAAPPGYGAASALQVPSRAQPTSETPAIAQRGCRTCELPAQRQLATAGI